MDCPHRIRLYENECCMSSFCPEKGYEVAERSNYVKYFISF